MTRLAANPVDWGGGPLEPLAIDDLEDALIASGLANEREHAEQITELSAPEPNGGPPHT